MKSYCKRCLTKFERVHTRTIALANVTVDVYLVGCCCGFRDTDYDVRQHDTTGAARCAREKRLARERSARHRQKRRQAVQS